MAFSAIHYESVNTKSQLNWPKTLNNLHFALCQYSLNSVEHVTQAATVIPLRSAQL